MSQHGRRVDAARGPLTLRRGRGLALTIAIAASVALVLAAPAIGSARSALRAAFPGTFSRLIEGGLGLYATGGKLVGGVGVSGDTSCADHFIAWRVRQALNLDFLAGVGGVSGDATRPDNIVFDITDNPAGGSGISKGGFGHPKCLNTGDPSTLPVVR